MSKRLGIFVFYDAKGEVDEYVSYMLQDMKKTLSRLVIICNGILNPEGKKILGKFSDDIVVRPNRGFDLAAWNYGMVEYCGFEEICKYDELVLFNDSFFGPLYSFEEIFNDMETREEKYDFWAITAHGEVGNIFGMCPYGYRPRYLQLYFLVVKNKMLQDKKFQHYWLEQPQYKKFEELCEKHEAVFTKYFEDLGYRYGVYSDTKEWESDDRKKNFSQHTFNLYDLLVEKKMPVIKRKFFNIDKAAKMRYSNTNEIKKIVSFIQEKTSYDMNLIYSYLLKRNNLLQLKNCFNWNYVLPYENSLAEYPTRKKVIIVAHLYYEELFDYAFRYLEQVPDYIDILLTVGDENKKIKLQERLGNRGKVILVDARGRDMSALLVGSREYIKQYDYICFLHDKLSGQKEFRSVGRCFGDLLWDCTVKTGEYIENIIQLFDKNEKLGFLCPPGVSHGTYFASSLNYWTMNYRKTNEILFELGAEVDLRPDYEPIALGNAFWCKREAIYPILEKEWKYEDFPKEPLAADGTISHALERCMPYVAQSRGYYSGWVLSNDIAETDIENYRYMFTLLSRASLRLPGVTLGTFDDFLRTVRRYVLSGTKALPKTKAKAGYTLREKIKNHTPKKVLKIYRRIRYGI